jgi:hypothetical protein
MINEPKNGSCEMWSRSYNWNPALRSVGVQEKIYIRTDSTRTPGLNVISTGVQTVST